MLVQGYSCWDLTCMSFLVVSHFPSYRMPLCSLHVSACCSAFTEIFQFSSIPCAQIELSPSDFKVQNVIPGDFNHDGQMDVLLMMSQEESTPSKTAIWDMRIHYGNRTGFLGIEPFDVDTIDGVDRTPRGHCRGKRIAYPAFCGGLSWSNDVGSHWHLSENSKVDTMGEYRVHGREESSVPDVRS